MKRLFVIIGGIVAMAASSGCVSWQTVKLRADVENLKQEMAQMKKGGNMPDDLRRTVADINQSVEALRTELGLLEGRIEAAQHGSAQNLKNLKKVKEDLETKLARLEEKIAILETQIARGGGVPQPTPMNGQPTPTPTTLADGSTPAPTAATPDPTPLAAETDEAIYRRAITLMDGEKYSESRSTFDALIQRYPKSKLADNARFWIGETYYREKEYASSILEYQKVVETYPKGDKVPAALYKQGLAFIEIGEKEGGLATLQQLVSKYPKSREAKLAKDAIKKAKQN